MLGEKIVIGAIHGWAAGGGFEWVLNCDLVMMGESCRCFFPEVSLAVFVTGGVTTLLPNLVGMQKAKELILFGEKITAEQALELGIAWRVAALPQRAARNVKWVLNRAFRWDLEGGMSLKTEATVEGFLDPETRERGVLCYTPY